MLGACAYVEVHKANLDQPPNGIRVYEPKVYLFVDGDKKESTLIYAPNYQRAYDIKPVTILAKHDFDLEIEEGQLKKVTSNHDTTAILNFFQGAADVATKAAGVGVSSKTMGGTFGLAPGIYELQDDGNFKKKQ
jgi:hypothetical protein